MGSLPPKESLPPLDVQLESTMTAATYLRHAISYVSEDHDQLRATALLYVPAAARDVRVTFPTTARGEDTPAFPTILSLHPTSPDGSYYADGRHPPLNYAVELVTRGFVVIAPDYPSMGRQAAYDCEGAEAAPASAGGHPSCSIKGVLNHMRAIDVLETLPYADATRLAAIGHSLGGHNAIFAALFDPRIKAVVSSCGWTPFGYYVSHLPLNASWAQPKYMPRVGTVYGGEPSRLPTDFSEMVAALAPRPFFSNSPRTDFNFNVSGVWAALPQLAPVWRRYATNATDALDLGDRLHVTFPEGGCAMHTFESGGVGAPECGHDFPDGTRLAAYAFLERHLAVPRVVYRGHVV